MSKSRRPRRCRSRPSSAFGLCFGKLRSPGAGGAHAFGLAVLRRGDCWRWARVSRRLDGWRLTACARICTRVTEAQRVGLDCMRVHLDSISGASRTRLPSARICTRVPVVSFAGKDVHAFALSRLRPGRRRLRCVRIWTRTHLHSVAWVGVVGGNGAHAFALARICIRKISADAWRAVGVPRRARKCIARTTASLQIR